MIKINLLPKSINQKRAVRNTAVLLGVLLVAVIAGGVTFSINLKGQVEQKNQELSRIQMIEREVVALEKERDGYKARTAPIKQKLDFISGVLEYNTRFTQLYTEVAKWTYEKVMYTSMSCDDGTTVTMNAQCRSLKDILRYWINMRECGMFTEVLVSDVGGYAGSKSQSKGPAYIGGEIGGSQADLAGIGAISTGVRRKPVTAGTGWITFKVTCKLDPKSAIAPPKFGGSSSGPASNGSQGGRPGGMPGGMPPGGGMPGGMPPGGGMPPSGNMPMPNP